MSHFSAMQKLGCTETLQSLSCSDLLALKDTIATKLTNIWTKEEAIGVILNYSQSAEELLKRRKIVREAILKYLIRHDVVIKVSADKQQLIGEALFYWTQKEWNRKELIDRTKHKLEQNVKQEIANAKIKAMAQEVKVAGIELEQARQVQDQLRRQLEEQARKREEEQARQAEEQKIRQAEEQIKRRVQEQITEQVLDERKRQLEMQMNIHLNVTQYKAPSQAEGDFDCQIIGEEFCKWFFILLNSQNPSFGRQPEEWGPQHFWDDAILHFAYSVQEDIIEQYQSSAMVSLRLLSLVKDEQLLFNPNISKNGMRCVTSPHGLVAIAVAGTIHMNTQCLGIFEQLFGLVRTPVGRNNWKMKYVNLQVKALIGQQEINQPSLSIELPALVAHLNELNAFLK
ncbi:uncharacterized protein C3orf38 homolog [Carcharodon carcharias]|uniref:uncharacterized protein C3orf38 homolog n=1 Tax=Carcharodon carcharias TaxID=13397 RepID=UPI001B7DD581|nr:uncharacterized protein C3orf38 homolog [Carcharodon carcharias]